MPPDASGNPIIYEVQFTEPAEMEMDAAYLETHEVRTKAG